MRSVSIKFFYILLSLILMLTLTGIQPVYAASIVVNSIADNLTSGDGQCTLREAVTNANNNLATYSDCTAGLGDDFITFNLSGCPCTITLTSGAISLSTNITITGTGASNLAISGGNTSLVFGVSNPGTLNLSQLTITGGSNPGGYGGGISIDSGATLNVSQSVITGNTALLGGGIFSNSGTITLLNSTVSNNTATGGGGGLYANNAGVTPITNITNSTITGNSATSDGIAIVNGGTMNIRNSTIANNTAGGATSGVYNAATMTLRNTIVANSNCNAAVTNGGNNIDSGTTCGFGSTNGSQSSTNPLLGTLTGSPAYFPLLVGSPAIDTGDNAICAASPVSNTSQNGLTRPQGSQCDVGAYEVPVSPTTLVNSVLPTSRTPVVGNTVTIFNTVINAGADTASGITLAMNPAPPGTFVYQQTNCVTNAVIGSPNPSLSLAAGGVLCYVLSFTPSATFAATNVHIRAQAANAPSTNLLTGINTWLLRSTAAAGPDIIALTTTVDFHQVACSGADAFAVALSNVGVAATGDITAVANTGSASLPLSISISETNPGTGAIIGDNVLQSVGAGDNRTVAVFVTYNGCVSFDPAANRIFIEFRDASNNVIGSTSTAVSTNR